MSKSLQRSGSDASAASSGSSVASSAASGGSAAAFTKKEGAGGLGEDILEQPDTFQTAIFGVLFTLSKEKLDASNRLAVLKILLDFIQLMMLVLRPDFGWDINEDTWIWKSVAWVKFIDPIIHQGYSVYIGLQLTVAVLLGLSLLLCLWVGWCFKNDNFPYIWPIRLLRVVVATFFMVFYIASLAIFLVALNCNWFSSNEELKYSVHAYPDVKCFSMPHMAYMVVAALSLCVFIYIAYAMTVADFELDPKCKRLLASPHPRIEVRALFGRSLMTISGSLLIGLPKVQAFIMFFTTSFLFWSYARWEPHLNQWVNHSRCGLFMVLNWSGLMLLVLTYGMDNSEEPVQFSEHMTSATVYGMLPALLLGFFASYARLSLLKFYALKAFRPDAPVLARLKDVYRFNNVYDVEVLARICRKTLPDDDEVLDPEAIKVAEQVIKVGMSHYHNDFFMLMTYSNFMLEVLNNYQTGTSQLQQAKKRAASMSDKFAIFVREQETKQRSQTHGSGESATDLVSYVEFQRNCRLLVRTHFEALNSMKTFWKLLLHQTITFSDLAEAFNAIDLSKGKADRTFKMVLDRYPSSPKVLRNYGQFLEHAKNDPWRAATYYTEADRQEDLEDDPVDEALMGETTDAQSMMSSKSNAVISINATGLIEMVNKQALNMFGYKKGDLEGKNISMLMPNPFSQRHNTFLKNYINTGKVKILDSVREVVGLHRERYVFPISLMVSKVSGTGMDCVFMGILRVTKEDPSCVKVLCMPQGIVMCADQRFEDWFGKASVDLAGHPVSNLVQEKDTIAKLLDMAQTATEAEFSAGAVAAESVHVLHRYSEPVECSVQFALGGTEANRVFSVVLRQLHKTLTDGMMVADNRGRIIYTNRDFRFLLNYSTKQASKLTLSRLMNPPYSMLHHKWMHEPAARVPLQSCRNAATVVMVDSARTSMPVKTFITSYEEGDTSMYVVNVVKSSWAAGLDERRLFLVIDFMGTVLEAGPSPDALFSLKPSLLIGTSIADFIDVFTALRGDLEYLVERMVAKAGDRPGFSWRVGVHPPVNGEEVLQSNWLARTILVKNTKPTLMQIEVKEPENEGELPVIKMYLWRADMVTGVIEVDRDTTVTKPACCVLHPSGMLFGCLDKKLQHQKFRNFIEFPGQEADSLLLDKKAVKGAMKGGTSFSGVKIGRTKIIKAFHADGAPLQLKVTAMVLGVEKVVAKCNFHTLSLGDPDVFKATLYTEEERQAMAEEEQDKDKRKEAAWMRSTSSELEHGADVVAEDLMSQVQEEEHSDTESKDGDKRKTDFKRGARFKKLMATLSSDEAKASLRRFELHTWLICCSIFVVHLSVFIALTFILGSTTTYILEVAACPSASSLLQRVQISARMLANIHLNNTNTQWYSNADMPSILKDFERDIQGLETAHQGLYMGSGKLRRISTDHNLSAIWEAELTNETLLIDSSQPYYMFDAASMWAISNQLIASARELLLNHAALAAQNSGDLSRSRDFQYIMQNGPTVLTAAYQQSLDGFVARTTDRISLVNQVGLSMLVVEGILMCTLMSVWNLWLLQDVAKQRYGLFLVFLVLPTALLRALASKKIVIDGLEDDDDDDEAEGAATTKTDPQVTASVFTQTFDKDKMAGNFHAVLSSGSSSSGSRGRRLWASITRVLKVLVGTETIEISKKKMVLNSQDTLYLTLPLLIWGILVVAIYACCYAILAGVSQPLAGLSMAGRVQVHSMQSIFTAHELVSQTAAAAKQQYQQQVEVQRQDMMDVYGALLYGSTASAAVVPPSASTPSATLFSSAVPATLFFREDHVCYDTEYPDKYCFTQAVQEYYQVTNYALDPMLQRLSEEMSHLAHDSALDIDMNSSHMDYIWRVGYQTLALGLGHATATYADASNTPITKVKLLHTILFILCIFFGAVYVLFLFLPFIAKAKAETMQVAQLLSQLPTEMDVEGLAASVLMMDKAPPAPPGAAAASERSKGSVTRRTMLKDGPPPPPRSGQRPAEEADDDDASSVADDASIY